MAACCEWQEEKKQMGYVIDTKHHCFAKRMAMVTAEKDKGTSWFKRENWEKACMHWTRAV